MRRFWLSLLLLLLIAPLSHAQTTTRPAPAAVTQITLGQSIVALNGPWKFHIGDSPVSTNSKIPLWAEPDFDDSDWQTQTLPGGDQTEAGEPILGGDHMIPGWAAHGHAHYAGYGWYRIRLQSNDSAPELALMLGYIDTAYEVYINGQRVGGLGHVQLSPAVYLPWPKIFKLPPTIPGKSGSWVLALRVASNPLLAQPRFPPINGGIRQTPVAGPFRLLARRGQAARDRAIVENVANVSVDPILFLVGIVALVLYFVSRRRQQEYLWIAACVLSLTLYDVILFLEFTTSIAPISILFFIVDLSIVPIIYGGLLGQLYLLEMGKDRRFRRAIAAVAAVTFLCVCVTMASSFLNWLPSGRWMSIIPIAFDAIYLLVGLVLLIMAWIGLRRRPGRESWIALTPGIAFACFYAIIFLRSQPFARGILPQLTQVKLFFEYLIPLAVGYILLWRFISQQKDRDRLLIDLHEAQAVQQVLIPKQLPRVAGLAIENEYRPARDVGGDFFQIVPHPADGSVLIVLGDVTGKGLQAAMLVALIVGAINTAVESSFDPLDVLRALNRMLCGRGHAHATGLALRIEVDGAVTLANAGHLPPHLNGKELPMEGALPLGMVAGAEFSVMHFPMRENDSLMLMSDGVVEAQDEHGHLFGFERVSELLKKPITAGEVATEAQKFGQQDDILVLRIVRTASLKAAIA